MELYLRKMIPLAVPRRTMMISIHVVVVVAVVVVGKIIVMVEQEQKEEHHQQRQQQEPSDTIINVITMSIIPTLTKVLFMR